MVVDEDGLSRIAFSPTTIKWVAGVLSGIFALIVGWFAVWDRIDSRWRHESVQAAQDKATAAEIKALADKAEAADKELARRAEAGRAWVFWSVIDSKAVNSSQWAELCKYLKRPGDVCARFEAEAQQYRQEATDAKRAAQAVGRDPK